MYIYMCWIYIYICVFLYTYIYVLFNVFLECTCTGLFNKLRTTQFWFIISGRFTLLVFVASLDANLWLALFVFLLLMLWHSMTTIWSAIFMVSCHVFIHLFCLVCLWIRVCVCVPRSKHSIWFMAIHPIIRLLTMIVYINTIKYLLNPMNMNWLLSNNMANTQSNFSPWHIWT